MKPGDHPDFFRMAAPEGRSRESPIRLDAEGQFWHEGERVEHPGLAAAMHTWIARHPENRRFILTNGYDWTYFTVEGAPYRVTRLRVDDEGSRILLALSDGTEEAWMPEESRLDEQGAISTRVKRDKVPGPFEAKFSRFAQTQLEPFLELDGEQWAIRVGSHCWPLAAPSAPTEGAAGP
jgi:hypothetical protein